MKIVKYQRKLQEDIAKLFSEIDFLSKNVDNRSRTYNERIHSFMNAVGSMFDDSDFSAQIEAVRSLLRDVTVSDDTYTVDQIEVVNYELLIRYFEKLDVRRMFVLFKLISDNHRRIMQNLNEVKHLFQYDDILSQGFLSFDEILGIIRDIYDGRLRIRLGQLAKLRMLLTTVVMSIFDMVEDVFSLFNRKFMKIKGILGESQHSIVVVLKIMQSAETDITSMKAERKGAADVDVLQELEVLSLVAEGDFLDSLREQFNDITRRMEYLDFKINALIHRTVVKQVIDVIDNVFDDLQSRSDDSAELIDFVSRLSDTFKVGEQKSALMSIFGEGAADGDFRDGLELF